MHTCRPHQRRQPPLLRPKAEAERGALLSHREGPWLNGTGVRSNESHSSVASGDHLHEGCALS